MEVQFSLCVTEKNWKIKHTYLFPEFEKFFIWDEDVQTIFMESIKIVILTTVDEENFHLFFKMNKQKLKAVEQL